jgi:DNA-binding NarL/FixJ family response regulator
MKPYTIMLADDHVLLRQGLRMIIEERYEVIGEAGDGLELLEQLKNAMPSLVIVDLSMPKLRGIEAVREIKTLYPGIKVLVLTMHCEREYIRDAMSAGADGYLLKEDADSDLFNAIEQIRQGKIYVSPSLGGDVTMEWVASIRKGSRRFITKQLLTHREKEVLKLTAEGKTSKEIAELLFISPRTVENHRAHILDRLKLNNTVELVKYAIKHNYV